MLDFIRPLTAKFVRFESSRLLCVCVWSATGLCVLHAGDHFAEIKQRFLAEWKPLDYSTVVGATSQRHFHI